MWGHRTLVPLYPCAVSLSLTPSLSLSLSRSLSVCIYTYVYIYMYIHIHIYIYEYVYVHVYITRLERHPMHWLGGVLSGLPGFCRGCCLVGLCMCLARSLSLFPALTTHLTALLSPSLCISSTVNAPHRSPPHISLSRCTYIYSYIYVYICIYFKH